MLYGKSRIIIIDDIRKFVGAFLPVNKSIPELQNLTKEEIKRIWRSARDKSLI